MGEGYSERLDRIERTLERISQNRIEIQKHIRILLIALDDLKRERPQS